jgi:hypothetical protein
MRIGSERVVLPVLRHRLYASLQHGQCLISVQQSRLFTAYLSLFRLESAVNKRLSCSQKVLDT